MAAMEQNDRISVPLDDVRRLFDLAVDSPLMCSGSFETDDVRLLRRLAIQIGVDPESGTPDEFLRDYPHVFRSYTRDNKCTAGTYGRRCNRPAGDPIHSPGAPEPTRDPDEE